MKIETEYDVAIIGGGLAGLSAAIQLRKFGHSVILFEKEKYPFHKVCGEYLSGESKGFLQTLGLSLNDFPLIDTLLLTSPDGNSFITQLPLGGFGISRYTLDGWLAEMAKKCGVHVLEEIKIDDALFEDRFFLRFRSQQITAKVCLAAYGKKTNLDVKWKRRFLHSASGRLNNYVAIKYHVKTTWKENVIGLHNFKNGYCGISRIENNTCCLCYMTKAEDLNNCSNSIGQLQKNILCKNPHLKKIFEESQFLEFFPVTISQINFNKKTQVENHVLMLGDAGGMITPLCGNGMSIALHTGKIASQLITGFLENKISREQLEKNYSQQWKHHFAKRLQTGRILQWFFGSSRLSNWFVQLFKTFPFLAKPLIKMTHGKPF